MRRLFFSILVLSNLIAGARTGINGIATGTTDGRYVTVTAINENIMRVTNTNLGEQPYTSDAIVLEENSDRKPVIVNIGSDMSLLRTESGITATLDNNTGVLTISAGPHRTITDSGERVSTNGTAVTEIFTTSAGSMYGAGERGHKLNLRGDTLAMYNRQNYGYTGSDPRISQMNITMPLFISSDGFALLFDDIARAEMILGNPIKYITENPEPVSYYFINGATTMADVTEQLSLLVGRQELPPFWSLGYISSRYGYRTQAETLGVIDSLKHAGYPLDGIVLDLYWYGKEQDMGRLDWDRENWPNPHKMLDNLKKKGVNLVAISQPYVLRNGKGIDNYNELNENKMLLLDSIGNTQEVEIWVGEGGMFDVSNPDTQQWLRNRYKKLTDMGISGWWGDLGEPEVHPLSGVHHNGLSTHLYHNQYGNDWSKIIYDLYKEEYPDIRLMTMMRGGTTGLQRYSVFPWSTDVSRSWDGIEPQIRIMLNSGLSGLGYMSHDVGGFAVDPDNAYMPELYVRWLQLGLFSPIFRTHAQQFAEPYNYPQYESIIQKLIKDRYRWLPYNYTLAYENATKGYPLVRPLNFTDATHTFDAITDEFLWGSEILVAPVIKEGTTSRPVTFPSGKWVDMLQPARVYEGYSTIDYFAPLDVIPLFIKAGAFIPIADYKMENTGDYNPGRLTINYYPVEGVESKYIMFDDNRISTSSIESNEYRLITFSGGIGGTTINISSTGSYPGAPSDIAMTLVIHRVAKPTTIRMNGRTITPKYNPDKHTLTFSFKWPVDRAINIDAKRLELCSQE